MPYRNHTLTKLMRDSIGGNSKTLMFVNISPAECNSRESYMSLFFSLATIMDLYYVLHNPFSSSEKRVKKYMVISVLSAIILASVGLSMTKA